MSIWLILFYSAMFLIVGAGIGVIVLGLIELQMDCRTEQQRELKRGHIERNNK